MVSTRSPCQGMGIESLDTWNTLRHKGRDSASGTGRDLSIIRPGATAIVAIIILNRL